MSQSSSHQADHRHINKRFAGLWQAFVVFAQSALTIQPRKGALHNPAFGQNLKANLAAQLFHNLQGPVQGELHPIDQLTTVASIGPEELQPAVFLDPPVAAPLGRWRLPWS